MAEFPRKIFFLHGGPANALHERIAELPLGSRLSRPGIQVRLEPESLHRPIPHPSGPHDSIGACKGWCGNSNLAGWPGSP